MIITKSSRIVFRLLLYYKIPYVYLGISYPLSSYLEANDYLYLNIELTPKVKRFYFLHYIENQKNYIPNNLAIKYIQACHNL